MSQELHLIKRNTNLMIRSIVFLIVVFSCWSCQVKRNNEQVLQSKIDSLQHIVDKNENIAVTLREISVMIDSIDVNRKVISDDMSKKEDSYNQLVVRMKEISEFVKSSQTKIAELDNKILKSGNSYREYASVIKNLETSLEERNHELIEIQKHAEHYANQNQNLMHLVAMQKSEIDDKLVRLQTKERELETLQDGVDRLLISSTEEKAQNCFIRAQLLEEAARRTKLAPRKKRNTRLEAIELYKMASFYGNEEADAKISELEKKI